MGRLDWILIPSHRLETARREYLAHYNAHLPYRGFGLGAPELQRGMQSVGPQIERRDRLAGLIHEYYRAT